MQTSEYRLILSFIMILGWCCTACEIPEEDAPYKDASLPIEERVNDLLPRMSLDDKVAQMGPGALIANADSALGYALSQATADTPDNLRLDIPGLKMADGPRGVRVKKATCFPVGMARGATWDPELERRVGMAMGVELKAHGGNLLLAPTMNILRHPGWGRAQETYGEDTHHLGEMSAGFIQGVQQHVMANAKHFALNSIEDKRYLIDVSVDERTLREVYLPHFQKAAEAGVSSFMAAYNSVNGQFCCENDHLLRDILKTEWKFGGFVVSDFLFAVHSTVPSVKAGCDIEMPVEIFYGPFLKNAVNHEKIAMEYIDDAVRRILRQKFRFGLFDEWTKPYPSVIECKAHTDLARETARKSIVLLKNEGGTLPLEEEAIHSIAVIGKYANRAMLGDGFPYTTSSVVTPSYSISPLEGISRRVGEAVEIVFNDGDDPEAMMAAASNADVTIVVASLTGREEGELIVDIPALYGGDRDDLNLPTAQEEIIRKASSVSKKCVVILEAGSAVTMEGWIDCADAILMAWYPGMEGGAAIAEILLGDVNPSAKLPISWPKRGDQLFPLGNKEKSVVYSYYHGYRYFDKQLLDPQFPFGFGLSYTSFKYGELMLSDTQIENEGEVTVSVDITNEGERSGDEIVQLYVGYDGSRVDRAVKDLKGFRRVHLEPLETKRVTMQLKARDLAYYDVTSKGWKTEQIKYRISVGASSRDIRRSADLVVW